MYYKKKKQIIENFSIPSRNTLCIKGFIPTIKRPLPIDFALNKVGTAVRTHSALSIRIDKGISKIYINKISRTPRTQYNMFKFFLIS